MLSTAEYKISFMRPATHLSKKRDFDNEIFKVANKVVSFKW